MENALIAPRFAVIGCGAIAESYFLPILSTRPDLCADLHLVDANTDRLGAMAERFRVTKVATSLDDVLDSIDAAIIATPHASHARLGQMLAAAGKHILCEKPMTTSTEDAVALITAADASGVILMVNNWRRHSPAFRDIKRIIAAGDLGAPTAASWVEGYKFSWPTKSGFYFTQSRVGTLPPPGIMLDIGSHVIDLLCWWLGANPTVMNCQTDSFGGPEVRATLVLDFAGAKARTELSYYQKLTNQYCIQFERGRITGIVGESHHFTLSRESGKSRQVQLPRVTMAELATHMITNFVGAIGGRNPPLVSGRDVLPSIKAISEGYQCAQNYDAPWLPRFGQ
jgi:predicted dehydrogenase